MLMGLDRVLGAAVVKARRALQLEVHLTADRYDAADQSLAMSVVLCAIGMKSSTSPTPSGVKKRVIRTLVSGKYSCLDVQPPSAGASDSSHPAGIEDRGEDARGVKARTAIPVDRSIGADKRDAAEVADQSVIGDRKITGHCCLPHARHGLRRRWAGR